MVPTVGSSSAEVRLEASWREALADQFEQPYMRSLREFLVAQKRAKKQVFPAGDQIFKALDLTPLPQVKVVIIGQDPYHGPGQAHGLCFSVPVGVPQPPSLVNIAKEINDDLGSATQRIQPGQGCLMPWAKQGVLLLNSVLTVEQARAASHRGQGWERFTDRVVEVVNERNEAVVFLLWGSYAQKKGGFVDQSKHCVLSAPHPSPLSAHRGFMGCGHFSMANAYLESHAQTPVDWFAVE